MKESGVPLEWSSEENYIFRLSSFKDDLLHWLQQTPSRGPLLHIHYCYSFLVLSALAIFLHGQTFFLPLLVPISTAVYPDYARRTVQAWVENTLTDLSVSRPRSRLSWGIPVPSDCSQTVSMDTSFIPPSLSLLLPLPSPFLPLPSPFLPFFLSSSTPS